MFFFFKFGGKDSRSDGWAETPVGHRLARVSICLHWVRTGTATSAVKLSDCAFSGCSAFLLVCALSFCLSVCLILASLLLSLVQLEGLLNEVGMFRAGVSPH